MKKGVLLFILVVLAMTSCEKNKYVNYATWLEGDWVCTQIDAEDITTDEMFYVGLINGKQCYGQIYSQVDSANGKLWKEGDDYTYSLTDNILTVTGASPMGLTTCLVQNIVSLDNHSMSYRVSALQIDGEEFKDDHLYTLHKVANQSDSCLVGIWSGETFGTKKYWQYYADGTFDYYFYDSVAGKYLAKEDNQGQYFLHGNFIATNYANDDEHNLPGLCSQCWSFDLINNDSILFKAVRATADELSSYSIARVSNVGD